MLLELTRSDALPRLARVSHVLSGTALEYFRRGNGAASGEVVVKAGLAEAQFPVDRMASERGAKQFKIEFPKHRLIDEEIAGTHCWLGDRIGELFGMGDPLDGSSTFDLDSQDEPDAPAAGWGNTVGFIRNGEVLGGIMVQPGYRQLFYGWAGDAGCSYVTGAGFDHFITTGELPEGKLLRREADEEPRDAKQPLFLSIPPSGKMSVADMTAFGELHLKLLAARVLGNAGAEGCAVGNIARVIKGRYAAYANVGGGEAWDVALPCFLLELAGGKVTDFQGKRILWSDKKAKLIAARDHKTHERLMLAM